MSATEEQRVLIEDRRQRAREAFYDLQRPYRSQAACLADTLETATQVKITPDVIEHLARCWDGDFGTRGTIEAAIVQDVCAALGFEIVE